MAARARTAAEYLIHKPRIRGFREIDSQATELNKHLHAEATGIVHTVAMGGRIAKQDIANSNEDIDDQCNYFNNATASATHIRWVCSFFDDVRKKVDPLFAKVPLRYLLHCI